MKTGSEPVLGASHKGSAYLFWRSWPHAFSRAGQILLGIVVVLIGCLGSVAAQEARLRTQLGEKGDTWVGQRVTLIVELLVPGFFAGTPLFDLPKVPDVLLIPPSESPVLSSEQIDGTSYTSQRHEFLVFARRPGQHEIPAFSIRLKFKRAPLDKEALAQTVYTTPVDFTAKAPPGAEKLAGLLSAKDLRVVERWQPEPGHAKAGDAFTRTISFTAPDIPAMAFPPFPAPEVDGLGIYRKDPTILDRSERGTLRGERREIITYVCQRAGHFVIPAARLTWWDLETKQLRTINFPERILEVAPNPAIASSTSRDAQPPHISNRSLLYVFLLGAALAAITGLLWKTRASWQRALAPFRARHLAPLNPPSHRTPR